MRVCCRIATFLTLGLFCGSVHAQVSSPIPPPPTETTLPEVVVQAPEQADAAPSDDGRAGPPSRQTGPFGMSQSYPRLREQNLDGLSSILRRGDSLFETAREATIVDRQQLLEHQPDEMSQAIEQQVGVIIQRTGRGQSSPYIRGLTGQQVLILVDGIRMNNSTFRSGANQYFNTVDPGQVDHIEVVRGPQSALWGSDAIGGAINIVTRGPSQDRGNYLGGSFTEYFSTADVGSYSRANLEYFNGLGGAFAGGSYLNVNDLARGGGMGVQPFTHFNQYAGDVKYNRILPNDILMTMAVQHFEQWNLARSDRFPPFSNGPPFAASKPTFFDPQQRDLGYLRLQGADEGGLLSAFMFTASYARQKEGTSEYSSWNTYKNGTAGTRDLGEFDVNTGGLTALLVTDLDYFGKLSYGADWYHDNVNSSKDRYNNVTGAFVGTRVPQFPDGSLYDRAGVFLNWDVAVTDRLDINTGVRYENVQVNSTPVVQINGVGTPMHIEPSYQGWIADVGMSYKLADPLRLCGSISEGFRAPNLDDLVATNSLVQQVGQDIPSVDLQPERSINYEVGLKYDEDRLRSQFFVFWTDIRDNIVRTSVNSGLFQRGNRDSYLQGCEWEGEYVLRSNWSVWGNMAYVYGQNLQDNIPLSRIPATQGYVGLRYRTANHRSWFEIYEWLVAKQDRLNFQDYTDARIPVGGTPGFQTLNVRMGKTFGKTFNHQVSLTVQNILNQGYRVHGSGVDGAGLNAIFGYTYAR